MSHEASLWAWKAPVKKSSHKFVLVAMAERAGEEALCWPSIKRLELDTCLNRKTVITALEHLEKTGFIRDTGERKGQTRQVKVYQLLGVSHREYSLEQNPCEKDSEKETQKRNCSKNDTLSETPSANSKLIDVNSPKKGTVKETQKRNSTKNGTVPNLPAKSTVFTSKESQKRDTESEKNQKRISNTDSDTDSDDAHESPDGVPGVFGSHLILDCHPYLYWFLRFMEDKHSKGSASTQTFAERLGQFGLEGGYCQETLNNFLTAQRASVDRFLMQPDHSADEVSVWHELIQDWDDNALGFIQEADSCLESHRERLLARWAA